MARRDTVSDGIQMTIDDLFNEAIKEEDQNVLNARQAALGVQHVEAVGERQPGLFPVSNQSNATVADPVPGRDFGTSGDGTRVRPADQRDRLAGLPNELSPQRRDGRGVSRPGRDETNGSRRREQGSQSRERGSNEATDRDHDIFQHGGSDADGFEQATVFDRQQEHATGTLRVPPRPSESRGSDSVAGGLVDSRPQTSRSAEPVVAGTARRELASSQLGLDEPTQTPVDSSVRQVLEEPAGQLAGDFRPNGQTPLTPSGLKSRAAANIAAIQTLQRLDRTGSSATSSEQQTLAKWSGWGGLGAMFDDSKEDWKSLQDELKQLLSEEEWKAARSGVLNAHYTHPAYVSTIWSALETSGLTTGEVLEPGCGSGTFIGLAPQGVRMTGVELDPTTAKVAQHLYPSATIRNEGYQHTPTTHLFDAAVGNVPFGDIQLHDPANNPGNHSIHNHFILKALAQTKPGGYVSVLTSRYTMDAANPAARRDMYERADLVTAIRLPTGAHSEIADTEAVTDLLVFRVRKSDETRQPFTWEHAPKVQFSPDTEAVSVNKYFTDHAPENVLGQMSVERGMYSANTLQVTATDETSKRLNATQVSARLQERLHASLSAAHSAGLEYSPESSEALPPQVRPEQKDLGSLRRTPEGFEQLGQQGWEAIKVPKTQQAELAALLDLRDQTRALLEMESSTTQDTPEMSAARQRLAAAYAEYKDQYGPLGRVTKTARMKSDGTENLIIRRPPVMSRFFNKDPFAPLTRAIEIFDEDSEIAKPAPILSSRQVFASYTPKGSDTPADALAISMEIKGRVDLEYCAYLLGYSDEAQARQALGKLVFDTPNGDIVPSEEYLSGNVRAKLDAARKAAETNPAFQTNVDALQEVMPPDLGITDITPTPGAPWIPPEDHEAFLRQSLDIYSTSVTYNPVEGWSITGSRTGMQQRTIWGTQQMAATQIFEAMLNNAPIRIMQKDEDNREYLDIKATEAAKGKAEQIEDRFKQWIWENPRRTERLLAEYNRRFNSLVTRSYDGAGSRLRLPGLAGAFVLQDHQKAAVARMIAEPSTGLFHEVGAGKTLEMVCGVMEQKRLGLVNKPMIVVPNHMLGQFEREWLQAFPHARILAADIDDISSKSGRGDFMARVTTSPWDAVICTQAAFKKIGVTYDTYEAYESQQLEALEEWIASATDRTSVRRAELKRQKIIEQLEKARAKHESKTDGGVVFEQLGVDYLVVDEAHHYKNLGAPTKLQGVIPSDSSGIAKDLDMKLGWLRKTHGARVATFATATPIANTMGEMWVMTHYLRPDLLQDAGLYTFDAWAKTFTGIETKIETTVGQSFKMRQRVARFENLPELMSMWTTFADVKTAQDLNLPTPDLAVNRDNQRSPEVVKVNIGPAMEEFNATVQSRAEAIDTGLVQPWEDNFLALTHDGRTMATDYRLLSGKSAERAFPEPLSPVGQQKVDIAADQIASIYHQTKNNTYLDDTGEVSNVSGALQLVFSDLGTPKPNQWNLYDELKDQLIQRGVPEEKIVFIHEAKTSVEKDRIFARARTGAISVLIGSTQKMGTGANMQARAIALHHLNAPWRPADLAQREGRIVRRGNQNKEVQIYRYVTESSFDTYMWQTLERKASFINQIMTNKLDGRSIQDVDISDEEASYAQVKAIASGNPLIMEEARLKNEVRKYKARYDAWRANRNYLAARQPALLKRVEYFKDQAALRDRVAARAQTGPNVVFTVNGVAYQTRKDAAVALRDYFKGRELQPNHTQYVDTHSRDVAGLTMTINGLEYRVGVLPHLRDLAGRLEHDAPIRLTALLKDLQYDRQYEQNGGVVFTLKDLQEDSRTIGLIRRLENHVVKLGDEAEKLRQQAEATQADYERGQAELEQENPWEQKLSDAKAQLADIHKQMNQTEKQNDHAQQGQQLPTHRPIVLPGVGQTPTLSGRTNTSRAHSAPPAPQANNSHGNTR